jgi:rod shape determining protein RodA
LLSTTPSLFIPQLINIGVGVLIYIILSTIPTSIWPRYTRFIYILSVIFLLTSFLGPNIRGAHRWIEVLGQQFQPSEIVKPFLILIFAALVSRFPPRTPKNFLLLMSVFLPVFLIIFRQPDLGNAIVFFFFFLSILIASGFPWKWLLVGILISVVLAPSFWIIMHDYQRQRILTFLNPEHDPLGTGYNSIQAVISIGSGGFMGLGLGKGTQSRLLFLPEYHTDFVFASLVEELGFVGGCMTLIFYTVMLIRMLKIGFNAEFAYGWYFAVGLFAQLFIQIVVNMGMNMGLLPITGITLPFVSYGGSSILSSFIGLGLLQALRRRRDQDLLVIG